MATPSSIPAWRIPWTEEPVRPQSIGSHRVRHDWSDLACTHGAFEILSVPFKRKVSIYPLSFWTPEIKTRWSSNQTLRATLPLQDPWAGEPKVWFKTLTLEEPLQYNYSPVCGSPTWGYEAWFNIMSLPLPMSSCASLCLQFFSGRCQPFSLMVFWR